MSSVLSQEPADMEHAASTFSSRTSLFFKDMWKEGSLFLDSLLKGKKMLIKLSPRTDFVPR